MNRDLATHLVGDTWITLVSRILTNSNALGHPDVVRERATLEASGNLRTLRMEQCERIEELVFDLLGSPFEEQASIREEAGTFVAALALDLVQQITFKLVETTRADQEANVQVIQPLVELFHHMLRNDLAACCDGANLSL